MLSDSEFNRVVVYVKKNFGIDLSQKRVLVNGRLETHFLRNGYDSFDEFMSKVEKEPEGTEGRNIVNVLTTNHTYFMRESVHFDYLRRVVLPYLRVKEAGSKDLRIWSGASSTGEEPYTLAMLLMDYFGLEHKSWDTRVLATDISTKVLQHAVEGVYLREQIDPLPENWKRRFFECKGGGEEYHAKPELKSQVLFRRFNLMDPLPFRKKLHVVFLRNVMIYFQDDVKYSLVNRIYDQMEPGGYFFIGTTESLDKSKMRFQYVQPSIYRKKE